MIRAIHSAGVDLGGTWIRVHAVDENGRRLKHLKLPSPRIKLLPRFLKRLLSDLKIYNPNFLTIGSRGMWLLKDRQSLQRSLMDLAQTVRVISDVELAFESALTPRNRIPGRAAGILLLAGTGAIAVGRDQRGRVSRAGGLGPLKGDEGSGYWIGREYLKRVLSKKHRKSDSIAKTAALAETVIKRSRHDRVCRQIRHEAQTHLADLVFELARRLKFRGRISVSWAGSLMNAGEFRRGVFKILRQNGLKKIRIIRPKTEPAEAAALWADKLQGFPAAFLTKR